MIEWANWLTGFIKDVGFPIACVVLIVGLVGWLAHRLGQFAGPLIRQLASAVMEFLTTTSKSVSVQTEILHAMSGEQVRQGSLIVRMHNHIFRDETHGMAHELEDDYGRRVARAGGDSATGGSGD